MMTLDEIGERVRRLELELADLRAALETERSVEGVRRGIESMRRGEGLDAREALADLRKELFPYAPSRVMPAHHPDSGVPR